MNVILRKVKTKPSNQCRRHQQECSLHIHTSSRSKYILSNCYAHGNLSNYLEKDPSILTITTETFCYSTSTYINIGQPGTKGNVDMNYTVGPLQDYHRKQGLNRHCSYCYMFLCHMPYDRLYDF